MIYKILSDLPIFDCNMRLLSITKHRYYLCTMRTELIILRVKGTHAVVHKDFLNNLMFIGNKEDIPKQYSEMMEAI